MSNFRTYMHVERHGNQEVQGIEFGEVYVFPKIDGTNSSLWLEDGILQAGSRRRHLSIGKQDNAGFLAWAYEQGSLINYFKENPTHRLFGEWLVPHTLKTYREDAWRKFYVFDVAIDVDGDEDKTQEFIPYSLYVEGLEKHNIDHLAPLCIINDPSIDQLLRQLDSNKYLIKDGEGPGEGIVLKNYDFYNKMGRQVWAKIVRTEFVEKNQKAFGIAIHKGESMVEGKIIDEYCTTALCQKVHAKISVEMNGWRSQFIPRLLQTVYYDIVNEDLWDAIKKHKQPVINFKTLLSLCNRKVKENLGQVFTGKPMSKTTTEQ